MNTAEQEFEIVVRHLFEQGKPALGANGNCVYRAPDGCKCAVGVRIPDADYRPLMEGVGVSGLLETAWANGWALPPEFEAHLHLFQQLQAVHDNSSSWTTTYNMRWALHEVVRIQNLPPASRDLVNSLSFKDR